MSLVVNESIIGSKADRHQRFGKSLILQIVLAVEGGLCRKQACTNFGMAYSTLMEWMSRYGSETYQLTKKSFFSAKQKKSIVRAVSENRMTKAEACIAYKVGRSLLNKWLRKSKQEEDDLAAIKSPVTMKLANCAESAVQKDLSHAILKIRALETMIDIAEEQFKISIRKKSGAKQ